MANNRAVCTTRYNWKRTSAPVSDTTVVPSFGSRANAFACLTTKSQEFDIDTTDIIKQSSNIKVMILSALMVYGMGMPAI